MGLTAYVMGDYTLAAARLQESIAIYPDGDQTSAWTHLGLIAQETHDLPAALHWLELAYGGAEVAADGWLRAFVMNYLADVRRELGQYDEAARLAQESLRLFTALGDTHYLPDAQITLAQITLDTGDLDTAEALATLAGEQYEARGDAVLLTAALLIQAELAWKRGRRDAAADLLRRAQSLRRTNSRSVSPHEQAQYDRLAQALAE